MRYLVENFLLQLADVNFVVCSFGTLRVRCILGPLHSERPKLYTILACLSAIGLIPKLAIFRNKKSEKLSVLKNKDSRKILFK